MAFLTFAVVPKIEPPKLLDTKGFWRSGIFGILARDHEMRSELRAGPGGFGVGPETSRDLSVLSKLLEQRNDAILPRKAVEPAACNWPLQATSALSVSVSTMSDNPRPAMTRKLARRAHQGASAGANIS